jgi:hypothetical protein
MSENPPPHPARPSIDPLDDPPVDPFLVDRLVDQLSRDPGAARDDDERALVALFAALRAPATPAELAAADDHLAVFDVHVAAQALRQAPHEPRRKSLISRLLAAKATVAAAALATLTAGTAAAAFTGSLPDRLQDAAHSAVGAPAAHPGSDHGTTPRRQQDQGARAQAPATGRPGTATSGGQGTGPDASTQARRGLCTAFRHGGLATTSVAYRNLVAAAGGADQVTAYCADPTTAGPGTGPIGRTSTKPTGKPSGPSPAGSRPGSRPTSPAATPAASPAVNRPDRLRTHVCRTITCTTASAAGSGRGRRRNGVARPMTSDEPST